MLTIFSYSGMYGADKAVASAVENCSKEEQGFVLSLIHISTYNVAIHFSKTSRETMTDKINRLILHDINLSLIHI